MTTAASARGGRVRAAIVASMDDLVMAVGAKPPGRAKPVTPLTELCPAGRLFAGFPL